MYFMCVYIYIYIYIYIHIYVSYIIFLHIIHNNARLNDNVIVLTGINKDFLYCIFGVKPGS